MLSLGKKINMKDETIEAYYCSCSGCGCTCTCYCSAGNGWGNVSQTTLLSTGSNNTGYLYTASTSK